MHTYYTFMHTTWNYVPVNLTLAFCKLRHSKALWLSVTGLFWCAAIFAACNSFLKMKTGVLDCFRGAIFHHFPTKSIFNLTGVTRQGERTTLRSWEWMLGCIGVLLMLKWPAPQHTMEPLRGGTLSRRQGPQICMPVLSWIKISQAVASQYTSKHLCWLLQFAALTYVDLQMQRLKRS